MQNRIISLIIVAGTMFLVVSSGLFGIRGDVSPSLVLGFMLLSAYCIGFILSKIGLPHRVARYIGTLSETLRCRAHRHPATRFHR